MYQGDYCLKHFKLVFGVLGAARAMGGGRHVPAPPLHTVRFGPIQNS